MFLGNRIARRGRVAIYTLEGSSSIPREPLFFLYPQWVRNAATAAPCLPANFAQETPSSTLNHLPFDPHVPKFDFRGGNTTCEFLEYDGTANKVEQSASPAGAVSTRELPLEAKNGIRGGDEHTGDDVQQLTGRYEAIETDRDFGRTEALVRRIRRINEKLAARRTYNRMVREGYEERKLKEHRVALPDWRVILDDLMLHTPDGSAPWHENRLRILVPAEAAKKLLLSEDDNIWSIKLRCGCQIEVSEANESSEGHRAVLISGPVTSVARAASEILQIAPSAISDKGIGIKQTPGFSTRAPDRPQSLTVDGSLPGVIRLVRADERRHMVAQVRADKIPRPQTWTSASFSKYVHQLTRVNVSTHMQKHLYKPGESHSDLTIEILKALFVNPECTTSISTVAFNDAISYLVKHNSIGAVRELYVHMEMQHLKMNTDTFNIMLRGAAKSGSHHNFQYIVKLMLRCGYSPNADTWLVFMNALEDLSTKRIVLESMKHKGLLQDPRIRKAAFQGLVSDEVRSSLEKEMPQEQFLKYMADQYGQDWLTKSTANRVLDVLGSMGLISRCWEFLLFMYSQNVKHDNISIQTILSHCQRQKNVAGAVEIIRRISSLSGLNPHQDIYRILFNMAWNCRLYLVARVVWRYACLDAATTYLMRKRVSHGVQAAISDQLLTSTTTVGGLWRASAGPFILGLQFSATLQQQATLRNDLRDHNPPWPRPVFKRPLITLLGKNPNNRKIVVAAVRKQMSVFDNWIPQRHFADALVEAYAIDKEWTSSGARYAEGRMEWLAARAPAIPLRRKTQLQGRQNHVIWK